MKMAEIDILGGYEMSRMFLSIVRLRICMYSSLRAARKGDMGHIVYTLNQSKNIRECK